MPKNQQKIIHTKSLSLQTYSIVEGRCLHLKKVNERFRKAGIVPAISGKH